MNRRDMIEYLRENMNQAHYDGYTQQFVFGNNYSVEDFVFEDIDDMELQEMMEYVIEELKGEENE